VVKQRIRGNSEDNKVTRGEKGKKGKQRKNKERDERSRGSVGIKKQERKRAG